MTQPTTTPTTPIPNRFKLYQRPNGDSCRLYVTAIIKRDVTETCRYTPEPKRVENWEKKFTVPLPSDSDGVVYFQIIKSTGKKVEKKCFKATPDGIFPDTRRGKGVTPGWSR